MDQPPESRGYGSMASYASTKTAYSDVPSYSDDHSEFGGEEDEPPPDTFGAALFLLALNNSGSSSRSERSKFFSGLSRDRHRFELDEDDILGPLLYQEHMYQGALQARHVLQEPALALQIGGIAGIPSAFRFSATCRAHARAIMSAVPTLFAQAVPHAYVCGGVSKLEGVLSSVHSFSLSEGIWKSLPAMPTPRRLCCAAVARGVLYVFGGEAPGVAIGQDPWQMAFSPESVAKDYRQLATAECFSPLRAKWETLAPMITARAGCSSAPMRGLLYVFGGRLQDVVLSVAERLDPSTGRWEKLPALPEARSGSSTVALGGKLYVMGGKGANGQILVSVNRFCPETGWWQILPNMRSPRSAFCAGAVNGTIYVVGGFDGTEALTSMECFNPEIGQWEHGPSLSAPHVGGAAAVAMGTLFIFGGKTGEDDAQLFMAYEPSSMKWRMMPPMPERRVFCCGATLAIGEGR